MTTRLIVAHLLTALPVFLAAMFLWWQAAADEELDDLVDLRFLFWDSPPQGDTEGTRRPEVSTTVPWPPLAAPLMATAAR